MDARKLGSYGEDLACKFLIDKGYTIIERNKHYYSHGKKLYEVDIIASKDNTIYIIEVKTRRGDKHGSAIESITQRKLITLYSIIDNPEFINQRVLVQLVAIDIVKQQTRIQIVDCS
jgi:putative endonuclease